MICDGGFGKRDVITAANNPRPGINPPPGPPPPRRDYRTQSEGAREQIQLRKDDLSEMLRE